MTENQTSSSTSAPKPGPRPGPRPGAQSAVKGAQPAAIVTPVPVSRTNDPSKFGRVEADGSAYVTTSAGERLIGSWQAGTPEEGLAHYGIRFEDLATEVELLEQRLSSHPEDANSIRAKAEEIKNSLPTVAAIGDLDALDARLSKIVDSSAVANERAKEEKAKRREEAVARKEALATEAEEIAENSTDWKGAGDRIRTILDEWKSIHGIERKTDDELWKRYSRARDSFNRRRGAHFAELDRGRVTARNLKEKLVERAEALKESTEWNDTARAFRDLMQEWKAAGRAPREIDDKLWAAFKGAQDFFFDKRNAVAKERDQEFEDNAAAKNALLVEYDSQIDPSKNLAGARSKLRELQEKWEEIGYVPRGQVRDFEDKIGALEKRVAEAEESQWRRTDPEAQARADQFTAKADDFNAQADVAEAKGNSKKAEKLRAQAAQWSEWAKTAHEAVDQL
ncbi:DUF349 domain-containing protein [uncultured Corynebacterium sp.]|uniref:DUF349 domain-containing protein n=1 Tax=uncultured Corynebacterium sp. TaxID=159447 RepID=UPI0025F03CBD|nr:DUF349 domain-containing protein [uncultured Corynebacterium sp.]